MFVLSVVIYPISANEIKCQMFHLENDGQGDKGENQDLHDLTANVYISEFFRI